MKNELMLKPLLFSLLTLCILIGGQPVWAQQAAPADPVVEQGIDLSPLTELGNEYQNSIKLLQNRFRIDYEVDEITMIFFREYGSIPVVLVRPDGSKIFSGQTDSDKVFWFDAETYDMISIKNPMPGPWQAIGQRHPDSRVMVLSDIRLHAEPLPKVVFSGEILKQTAYLTNGDKPIDNNQFRDVVTLYIDFTSTNNPNFDNFGADLEEIAEFADDGMGMDERPMDGVFTGQFNLSLAPGEWTPVFKVQTPMFSREQIDSPIVLYPNPIKIGVELDGGGEGYHKILIDTEREYIDINSLLIDGKIRFPNGDIQNFSLTEHSPDIREHMVVNYEYGVFRISLTAYGKTHDGRDFIMEVPEYTFLSEPPELQETDVNQVDPVTGLPLEEGAVLDVAEEDAQDLPAEQGMLEESDAEQMSTTTLIIWIVSLNLTLVVLGAGTIWFLIGRKSSPKKSDEIQPQQQQSSKDKVSLVTKLTGIFSFKKKSVEEKLTMPDES